MTDVKRTDRCETCYFACKVGLNLIECRRYPRVPYPIPDGRGSMGQLAMYPMTEKDLWCGEWKTALQ